MARKGCDSETEPSAAQVAAAVAAGFSWWAPYRAGRGAAHNWSDAGIAALRAGGLNDCLPVFVPALTPAGLIVPSAVPEADAQAFVSDYAAAGIAGAGALDTEASMRGDPWTRTYAGRFCGELRQLGQADVCYAGGFSLAAPPPATHPWWIVVSSNPPAGAAYQAGQQNIDGVQVDVDWAGDGFPLASLHPTPPPTPPPAYSDGGNPVNDRLALVAITTGINGEGYADCDGDPGAVKGWSVQGFDPAPPAAGGANTYFRYQPPSFTAPHNPDGSPVPGRCRVALPGSSVVRGVVRVSLTFPG